MTADNHQTLKNTAAVLTKATLRAAERLGVDDASLACIIGVNAATILGYRHGDRAIALSSPEGRQAVLLTRIFRALDALVGAHGAQCLAWMTSDNTALGDVPLQVIQQPGGLAATLAYLERHAGGASLATSDGPNL